VCENFPSANDSKNRNGEFAKFTGSKEAKACFSERKQQQFMPPEQGKPKSKPCMQ
jgi:hypothetical protein